MSTPPTSPVPGFPLSELWAWVKASARSPRVGALDPRDWKMPDDIPVMAFVASVDVRRVRFTAKVA